jgi:alkanesulfonate monooxygenase SsuD/methylene tetrahydromethanopterin reductase-like flavin-dependent oxidoreductase (luciferase family)
VAPLTSLFGRDPSLGVQPWPQATEIGPIVDLAQRAELLGYEAIWAPDHLLSPHGSPDQPVFEAIALVTAWAMSSTRISLGCLVAANTFRNPFVLMKSLVTIDHLACGRVILGIGGGWFEAEHAAAGIEFGASPGERLRWLEEAVVALRSLRAGETHSRDGHYRFVGSRMWPAPIGRMPFMIGGSGEQKTLRIVAEHADLWNSRGSEDVLRAKLARLDELCVEVGRDPSSIVRSASVTFVIRDDPAEAERVWESQMAANQNPQGGRLPGFARSDGVWFGPPEYIAGRLQTYLDMGFSHFVVDAPAPYDEETLTRLALEVRPLISGSASTRR